MDDSEADYWKWTLEFLGEPMTPEQHNLESITCPKCNMTSHNPNDIEWGYCGNCHEWTSPVNPLMKAKRFVDETRPHREPGQETR